MLLDTVKLFESVILLAFYVNNVTSEKIIEFKNKSNRNNKRKDYFVFKRGHFFCFSADAKLDQCLVRL